jgi:hypothetical protein
MWHDNFHYQFNTVTFDGLDVPVLWSCIANWLKCVTNLSPCSSIFLQQHYFGVTKNILLLIHMLYVTLAYQAEKSNRADKYVRSKTSASCE